MQGAIASIIPDDKYTECYMLVIRIPHADDEIIARGLKDLDEAAEFLTVARRAFNVGAHMQEKIMRDVFIGTISERLDTTPAYTDMARLEKGLQRET